MVWDGKDRRKEIRRDIDRTVCPFHKIKCDSIQANKKSIHEIEVKMATKEDLKNVSDDVNTKAPRWVLILLVGLTAGMLAWMVTRVETKFEWRC